MHLYETKDDVFIYFFFSVKKKKENVSVFVPYVLLSKWVGAKCSCTFCAVQCGREMVRSGWGCELLTFCDCEEA